VEICIHPRKNLTCLHIYDTHTNKTLTCANVTSMWLLGTHFELAFPHGDHGPPHGNMLEGSAPLAHKKIIPMLENILNTLIFVFKAYIYF